MWDKNIWNLSYLRGSWRPGPSNTELIHSQSRVLEFLMDTLQGKSLHASAGVSMTKYHSLGGFDSSILASLNCRPNVRHLQGCGFWGLSPWLIDDQSSSISVLFFPVSKNLKKKISPVLCVFICFGLFLMVSFGAQGLVWSLLPLLLVCFLRS